MFQVDTTTGTIEPNSFNISFPGLATFKELMFSLPSLPGDWIIVSSNGPSLNLAACAGCHGDVSVVFFTPAPTEGSLVGFTRGSILMGGLVFRPCGECTDTDFYNINGGSITPVPEPSSLVLFASGMLALGLTLRFGKKVDHQLRA
jgi:hypothetical protein